MNALPDQITFTLPAWVSRQCERYRPTAVLEERMDFVIEAASNNVRRQSGGPFAAAIFEIDSGALVALGVNRVTTGGLSLLHAEMVAIAVAQRRLGVYALSTIAAQRYELITSTEPCAMCYGAIPWSGVVRVVSGARAADAEAIGFDEGPKPPDWVAGLTARGIEVVTEVCREQARQVLSDYQRRGGTIYNPGRC
jgi:tRNA(Arg) A34 adenosine deaminase TadA